MKVETFTYRKTFSIVRMYFSMLNNMETISKTLKWTIICDISQLYSQAFMSLCLYVFMSKLYTTNYTLTTQLVDGRLKNKVAIKVMDNATKSRVEII